MRRASLLFAVATVTASTVGCTAVSVSPPLSAQRASPEYRPGHISLTSGNFGQPHEVIGVVQMTQKGYKWFHEVEVVDDANPGSILYKLAIYAHTKGAHGVQHLELIDMKPQSPGEKASKQIDSAIRIHKAVKNGKPGAAAREGSETRWEIRGELVRFTHEGQNS